MSKLEKKCYTARMTEFLVWFDVRSNEDEGIDELGVLLTNDALDIAAELPMAASGESDVLSFLESHCAQNEAPAAGAHVRRDRRLLRASMPAVDAYLHYRLVDLETLDELAAHWNAAAFAKRPGGDDARSAIARLKYYRHALFNPPSETPSADG